MLIHKIKMENFRGFRDKTIEFRDKSVVLLSAANGLGKTTTVDAIEWCLTGEIGRLKNAFDTRSTNETERKMNTDGILKHRDAEANDKVRVIVWLLDGNKEIILCREQKKDELNPSSSKVTIDGSEEIARKFIREYVGKSFYNFHFCDVQKSFNVQSTKRKELNDLFGEFITNYDEQKQIADKLDIFIKDVERYIEDKEKQRVSEEVIETYKQQIAEARQVAKQVPYPAIMFYRDEHTKVEGLNKEALIAQKEAVQNCGYQVAKETLLKLVKNERLKSEQLIIKDIVAYWETKGDAIQRAVKVGFLKGTEAVMVLEKRLEKIKSMILSKDTILQDGESVIALENAGFQKPDFDTAKNTIKDKEKKVKDLSDEIELISKNNKMLQLLSSLSANKKVVIEYRNTVGKEDVVVRCPVCGSEAFATVEENLILKEADEYIRQNGETVKVKEVEKTLLQEEIATLYQKMINCAQGVVEIEKKKLVAEINNLKALRSEIQPYFEEVQKLQEIRKEINIEELDLEKVRELLIVVEGAILEESKEQVAKETYQQILSVLGYDFENETLQQTYVKVENLITAFYEVSDFSYDVFVSKLNSINSILTNQRLLDLEQRLEESNKKNKTLEMEVGELQRLRSIGVQRAKDIRNVIEQLAKDEYKKVGPTLSKFYNKLARFNSSSGINIVQENEGISIVDDKGKNIVNVLSNGQLSVFMLAYFFAGINARNDYEKLKVFFIDDLTACMDDVNMLAFMDLLKYQISSKATMEQLFFITCDDRISNLLKYKLDGRGIEICELIEADFV